MNRVNRFEFALQASAVLSQVPLCDLARNFADAIDQVEAEGEVAVDDPAVLLLGSFIAFHTHADVNTASGYRKLVALCNDRLYNARELQ